MEDVYRTSLVLDCLRMLSMCLWVRLLHEYSNPGLHMAVFPGNPQIHWKNQTSENILLISDLMPFQDSGNRIDLKIKPLTCNFTTAWQNRISGLLLNCLTCLETSYENYTGDRHVCFCLLPAYHDAAPWLQHFTVSEGAQQTNSEEAL